MATKTRQRLPRAEREERMLDAAETVFGRHGFHAASMDEIARRSGITKALLYQYFGSKEGLCEACVERSRARLFDALREAVDSVPLGEGKVVAFVNGYFDHIDANRESMWLLYAEASTTAVTAMRKRSAELIAELLSDGFEQFDRKPDRRSIELLAEHLVGAGEQVARWWTDHPEVSKRAVTERFLQSAGGAISAVFESTPVRSRRR
jgi:AcrR family transcriptional regulator